MPKPTQQWQTRMHTAIRTASLDARADVGARAESFELHDAGVDGRHGGSGHRGWASFGLERQLVDAQAAADPDMIHAVSAWLIARGGRTINLYGPDGAQLAAGPITPAALGVHAPEQLVGRERLISLCPSNLEALAALGCFDRVIACEDSSDFPPAVAELERLGPDLGPDLDRVAALAPDLVVSSLSVPGMERNVTGLRARGLTQVVLAPRSLADVLAELGLLGDLLGVAEQAAAVIADMRRQIRALEANAAEIHAAGGPARVYLEWWPRPMFSPGRDCYSNELIRLAGGVNVFADRPGASLEIDAPALLAADPELCFVSWCGVAEDKLDPAKLIERPGLEDLPAARAGAVHVLDEQFAGRPGPRMLEAARRMAAAIRERRGLGDLLPLRRFFAGLRYPGEVPDDTDDELDPLEQRWLDLQDAIELGDYERATAVLAELADELGPDHPDVLYEQAVIAWEQQGPEAAVEILDVLLQAEPEYADGHYARALICEEADDAEGMILHFLEVLRLDALAYEEFGPNDEAELDFIEDAAEQVLDVVPEQFRALLANVPVVLEERPHPDLVREGFDPRSLGLFEGLEQGRQAGGDHVAPTRIVLFYGNLLADFPETEALLDEIEITLLHEIGHYFGLDEDEVERLGLA